MPFIASARAETQLRKRQTPQRRTSDRGRDSLLQFAALSPYFACGTSSPIPCEESVRRFGGLMQKIGHGRSIKVAGRLSRAGEDCGFLNAKKNPCNEPSWALATHFHIVGNQDLKEAKSQFGSLPYTVARRLPNFCSRTVEIIERAKSLPCGDLERFKAGGEQPGFLVDAHLKSVFWTRLATVRTKSCSLRANSKIAPWWKRRPMPTYELLSASRSGSLASFRESAAAARESILGLWPIRYCFILL